MFLPQLVYNLSLIIQFASNRIGTRTTTPWLVSTEKSNVRPVKSQARKKSNPEKLKMVKKVWKSNFAAEVNSRVIRLNPTDLNVAKMDHLSLLDRAEFSKLILIIIDWCLKLSFRLLKNEDCRIFKNKSNTNKSLKQLFCKLS